MSAIKLNNLTFKYSNKLIFDNIDIDIKKSSWTTIIGKNGVGKTTLSRILSTIIKVDNIFVFDEEVTVSNRLKIREKIGLIFENPDMSSVMEYVRDEILFGMENLKKPRTYQNRRFKEITKLLEIESLLTKKLEELSGGEKQLVQLASCLVLEPEIIILDEALSMIDTINKTKIYNILKQLCQEKKVTIIDITHDIEDALLSDQVILLGDMKILADGEAKDILTDVKMLKKGGYEPPFIINLSIKLQYYNLVDKVYFNMNKLVNDLWK